MKKISCVLAVVAWLYLGTTFILGGLVRERYLEVLEEAGGGALSLSNESYEQGLFTSRAVTMIKAAKAEPSGDGDTVNQGGGVRVRHTFHHGPFTFSGRLGWVRLGLALVENAAESVPGDSPKPGVTFMADTPFLNASLLVGFGNDLECALNTAALSCDVNGTVLALDNCVAHVIHDPDTQAWRGEITLPKYTLSYGDFSFAANGNSIHFDVMQSLPWVFVGQSEIAVSSMNMTRSGQSIFTMEDLRLSEQSSIDGGLVTSRGLLNLLNATAGEFSCGPVVFDMEIRDMNATTISDSYTDLKAIVANRDVRDLKSELASWNQRLSERLMAEGVTFDIRRLSVSTSIGALECSLGFALEGSGENVPNPLALLDNLNATAGISVDESLVVGVMRTILQAKGGIPAAQDGAPDIGHDLARQIVSQQVEPMVAQGLLRREGGVLKADAVFEKRRLLVNNQPVPLL
jgi:uncharacterized protein YdgA (DUF945 family)